MIWLDPRTWLAIIGIAAAFFIAGYVTKGRHVKSEIAAANAAAYKQQVETANKVATELEGKKSERADTYRTITKTVTKLVDRPVYRRDCVDADGLRVINDALKGSDAFQLDTRLSAANPA